MFKIPDPELRIDFSVALAVQIVPHPVSRTQVCHAAGLTDNTAFHFSLA